MINKNLAKAIIIIYEKLKNERFFWRIAGSTSLFLQGIKVKPKDMDIITDKAGAIKIQELLKDFQKSKLEFSRTDKFASYKADFKIKGIDVEVMGDLEAKIEGKWIKRRIKYSIQQTKIRLNNRNLTLPLTRLSYHLKSYKGLKREKDKQKIELIKQALRKK